MTVQRFLLASVAGGVSMLVLGFVSDLLSADALGGYSMTGADVVHRDGPATLLVVPGALAMGALLTVLIGCWTGHTEPVKALRTSAVFGLLLYLFLGLSLFGMTTMLSLTGTLIKVVIDTVQVSLSGMAVGAVLDRGRRT